MDRLVQDSTPFRIVDSEDRYVYNLSVKINAELAVLYNDETLHFGIFETILFWRRIAYCLHHGIRFESEDRFQERKHPLSNLNDIFIEGETELPDGRKYIFTVDGLQLTQDVLNSVWALADAEQAALEHIMGEDRWGKAFESYKQPKPETSEIRQAPRPPNFRELRYKDGEEVWFEIDRITAGAKNGVLFYNLWSPLYSKRAILTINSDNPAAMKEIGYKLTKLGMSVDKIEVKGRWRLDVRVAHVERKEKDGSSNLREYLNPIGFVEMEDIPV